MSLDLKRRLAIIDVETTGFFPDYHEVIEIGCAIVERDESDPSKLTIVDELEMKVKMDFPERADEGALRVNGYNEAEWIFAYTQEQAFQELAKRTKGCVFVAHNVAFDWGFVEASMRRYNINHDFHYHKLDTLSIAFAKFHGSDFDVKRLSLRALCEHFGIVNEKAHTALADVRATVQILSKLLAMK